MIVLRSVYKISIPTRFNYNNRKQIAPVVIGAFQFQQGSIITEVMISIFV